MQTQSLVQKLLTKKTKDYTYTIAFFFTFSFFLLFIIRPNVLSIFNADQKIKELQAINQSYEKQISRIVDLQTSFETSRNDFGLLQQAVARSPQVNKILSDLNTQVSQNNIRVDQLNVSDINLKDITDGLKFKTINLSLYASGTFDNMLSFIQGIANQRRLKLIKKVVMKTKDNTSSPSGELKVNFEIDGYYL